MNTQDEYWANHTCTMVCSHIRPEDMGKRDDAQLRGEINILLYELTDSDDVVKELGDKFESLFQAEQQQLLTELEGQKKHFSGQSYQSEEYAVPISVIETYRKKLT